MSSMSILFNSNASFQILLSSLIVLISGTVGLSTLWSLFLVPSKIFGLQLYFIDDERQLQAFKSRYVKSSSIINNNEALGWVFGQWYIGYIQVTGDMRNKTQVGYVLAPKSMISKLAAALNSNDIQENNSPEFKKSIIVRIFDRCGHYDYLYYLERKLDVTHFIARDNQQKAINIIKDFYSIKRQGVVLLSGPANSGKSVIALLLAKDMSGALVYEFNPTEPSNNFNTLYNKANPTFSTPLIVCFEEVDNMIEAIHNNKVVRHDSKPIAVHNKATWNTFMDHFDHQFYPFVIFLFTTNRDLSWFDGLDPSYMRSGRTNIKLAIGQGSCELIASDLQSQMSCDENVKTNIEIEPSVSITST